MEQTQYWMWTKQKQMGSPQIFQSSSSSSISPLLASRGGDSWEEQAFAEDAAAGALGGCIWPPRSYSCTFCKKEFRSAQALGGHMNVHRRDRARLKQSQGPQSEAFPHEITTNNSILLNQGTLLEAQSQHQACNFLFNPNLEYDNRDLATTSSPIRVSSAPRLVSNNNETQYLFPYVQEQSTIFPPKSSLKNLERQPHFLNNSVAEPEFITKPARAKGDNIVKSEFFLMEDGRTELGSTMSSRPNNKRDILKADLSISLNLVICRNNPSSASEDEEEEDRRCKRRRVDPGEALNLFYNIQDSNDVSSANDQLGIDDDDVDLELRLGDPPKVK